MTKASGPGNWRTFKTQYRELSEKYAAGLKPIAGKAETSGFAEEAKVDPGAGDSV